MNNKGLLVVFLIVLIVGLSGCHSVSLFDEDQAVGNNPVSSTPASSVTYTPSTTYSSTTKTNTETSSADTGKTLDSFTVSDDYECEFSVDASKGDAVLTFRMPNIEFYLLHSYIVQTMLTDSVAMKIIESAEIKSGFTYSEMYMHSNLSSEEFNQFISNLKQVVLDYYGNGDDPAVFAEEEALPDASGTYSMEEPGTDEYMASFLLSIYDSVLTIGVNHHSAVLSYPDELPVEEENDILDYLYLTMGAYLDGIGCWEGSDLEKLSAGVFMFKITGDFADLDVFRLVSVFADLLGLYLNTTVTVTEAVPAAAEEVVEAMESEEVDAISSDEQVYSESEASEVLTEEEPVTSGIPEVVPPAVEQTIEQNPVVEDNTGINWRLIIPIAGGVLLAFGTLFFIIRRKRWF